MTCNKHLQSDRPTGSVLWLIVLLMGWSTAAEAASVTRGPYLQIGTPNSIVVRWRTDTATDSRVRYGPAPGSLTLFSGNATVTTEHEVTVNLLSPDTLYYYSVGTSTAPLAGDDANHFFVTSPPVGTPVPTRIWVLGDSGTANSAQINVRNAYYNATAERHTDLWLMLGDNAYQNGTDSEYQAAVFNIYQAMLRKSVLWPALGNHDTAGSTAFVDTYPYFSIFTLPKNAEAGGIASGSEHYYSFDFGNIHFICLDSMTANRATNGPMANWLRSDLAATPRDWIIAYWHHPPYSKGSHNSDTEIELIQMRQNFLPILEEAGVDLVLAGHSHSYERSYLLDGHYGASGTLSGSMIKDGGSGRDPSPYQKSAGTPAHQGAVYSVAGSSGQISGGLLNHPAMFVSLNVLGSLVVDVVTNRMDVNFLDNNGVIQDFFAIVKASLTPPAPPSGLAATPGNNQVALTWNASSGATSYNVKRATTSGGPYGTIAPGVSSTSYTDTTAVNGTTYYYVVSAVNGAGESANSSQVSATPQAPPPPAPTGLAATPGNNQVSLIWNASSGASSYNVKRATTSGGPYATIAPGVAGTSYTDATAVNGTTYYYVVSAVNGAGESANSSQVSATPEAPSVPAAPTNLSATASGKKKIRLTWTQSTSPNVTQNNIYRSTTAGGSYSLVATIAATTFYNNTGLTSGTTYYYVVTAVNSSGLESPTSNEESATAR